MTESAIASRARLQIPPFIKYIFRRLIYTIVTFVVVTVAIFGIAMLVPPDKRAELYLPPANRAPSPEIVQRNIERIIRERGLADPFPQQYGRWISGIVRGDWGWSPAVHDVLEALLRRSPATAEITFYSVLVYIPMGLMSGAIASWNRNRLTDRGIRFLAFIGTSVPSFILGLIFMAIFYVGLYWFMPSRISVAEGLVVGSAEFTSYTGFLTLDGLLNGRPDITLDAFRHLALPVLSLGMTYWATLSLVTRSAISEELGKDYIVGAQARGLSPGRILWRHALGNAITPALTNSALLAASLVTGVYVIEAVFNWHGVSELIVLGMGRTIPDVPLTLGFTVYTVLVVLLLMFILDIVQGLADPRVREGRDER